MRTKDMSDDTPPELPAEIRQAITRHKAPPGLERRIRHAAHAHRSQRARLMDAVRALSSRWVPVAASFACGVLVAIAVLPHIGAADRDAAIEQEVVDSHVRSLMASHLTDVPSSDRHTVKPWFAGKLDYAPPVPDLASEGFPLVGGRLDYVQDRPVAALVYRRRGHTINVFVLPAGDARASQAVRHVSRNGFQVDQWEAAGMRFWAVSDINRDELAQFVAAMKAAS